MKKYIAGIMLAITAVFAFIVLLMPLKATISADKDIKQLSDSKEALVEVKLPQANGEKISSLQLRLTVVKENGEPVGAEVLDKIENISFEPDETVSSKTQIWDGIYHKDNGTLDVYIAGEEPLFTEEDKLQMGTVTATLEGLDKIYVKVEKEALQVVKGTSLVAVTDEQNAVINIYDKDSPTEPDESAAPTKPAEPTEPVTPTVSGTPTEPANPTEPGTSIAPDGSETPTEPETPGGRDTSKLRSALDIAETLQESDYTPESYDLLKKAMEKARTLLNNPDVTQEELDRAASELYNAIGTLVRKTGTSAESKNNDTSVKQNDVKKADKAALTEDSGAILPCVIVLMVSAAVFAIAFGKKKKHDL